MRALSNPFALVVFAVDAALCVLSFDQVRLAAGVAPADADESEADYVSRLVDSGMGIAFFPLD